MAGSETGQALVITGTTGSGKTTTSGRFVAGMDALWLHFGVDLFMGKVVPRQFVDGGPRDHEGLHMVPDDPANPEGGRHMVLGHLGPQMLRTFHRMAAEGVRQGARIVLDHVCTFDPPLLADLLDAFRGLPVTFVCLKPAPEVVPARIDARLPSIVAALGEEHGRRANDNTRLVSQYMAREIYAHDCFDLVVDTGLHPPAAVVRQIAARLAAGPGTAFAELTRRLDAGEAPFAGKPRVL
ncbi:MAG: hypothetical protein KGM17_15210 [Sphingomonadales bacterium]|nr:hypothetical protein [Sphingomonadales bacterium]